MAEDNHIVETQATQLDCNALKVKIKTNETINSYAKVIVKCDVKCSLAQQYTYKRLMEKEDDDSFGYEVGNYSLLDDYESRAKRIAATYARFYLETEDLAIEDHLID